MKDRQQTQKEIIRNHLKSGRGITQAYAYEKYRCFRLASIINRLRKEMNIKTEILEYGGVRFGRYTLVE